jgi:hypothetical protein
MQFKLIGTLKIYIYQQEITTIDTCFHNFVLTYLLTFVSYHSSQRLQSSNVSTPSLL